MTAPLDVSALLARLYEAAVRYVIIGGFAVIALGWCAPRGTWTSVLIPPRTTCGDLPPLPTELQAEPVGRDEVGEDAFPLDPTNPDDLARGGNFLVETVLGRRDIMQGVPGMDADGAFDELAAEAEHAEAFGVAIRVASLDHLRRMKRAAGRPRALQYLEDLAEAHGSRTTSARDLATCGSLAHDGGRGRLGRGGDPDRAR